MNISVRRRRVLIRIALAADVACAIAVVVRASLPGFHSWGRGLLLFVTLSVSVVTGLLYLRSTRGRS